MSYIRSGSNPEGLYIIGNTRGQVEFLGADGCWGIPRSVFHHVALRWFDGAHEDKVSYRGLTVEEKQVAPNGDFKVVLTYKDHTVKMWAVTWDYIVNGIAWRERKLQAVK